MNTTLGGLYKCALGRVAGREAAIFDYGCEADFLQLWETQSAIRPFCIRSIGKQTIWSSHHPVKNA